MINGTGLPPVVQSDQRLTGSAVLVETAAITEIAHSAYQLDQIRAAREERMRLGQTDEDGEDEGDLEVEGEGPMPKYPRGMLKFELSDGTTTLRAIEYRSIPEISLGKTPLGFKMLLKNPLMRHGIIFLEPNTVELLGHQTIDRELLQSSDFKRGLRVRLGLPDQPENDPQQPVAQQTIPEIPQAPPLRSPLREISPPPDLPPNPTYNDDANLEPRRRKLPSTNTTAVPTQASTAPSATLVASQFPTTTSQYFSNSATSSVTANTGLNGLNLGLTTAQASQAPAQDEHDDDEEAMYSYFDSAIFLEAPDTFGPDENAAPPPPAVVAQSSTSSKPIQPQPSRMGMTSSSTTTLSSSSASTKPTPTTRSLVPEDSIEIVSFTSSQAPPNSQPPAQTQSRGKGKGKGKEKVTSSNRGSSSGPVIDVSGDLDLDLDPLFLKDSDEVEPMQYADAEFQRQQRKEFTRKSGSGSPTSSVVDSASARHGGGRGQGRPIKPLPKPRKSLQSSQGSSQPQNSQSRSQSQSREVIEIGSDSSSSSSPRIPDAKLFPKARGGRGGNIDFLDDDGDFNDEEEEQYDKENMPVMTRHVRRKIASSEGVGLSGGIFGSGRRQGADVIELSDED